MRYYAIGTFQTPCLGGRVTIDEQEYSANDLGDFGFTAHAMWLKGRKPDGSLGWIEVGFGRGWYGDDVEGGVFYWGVGDGGEHQKSVLLPPENRGYGTFHQYEISFDGASWKLRIDGNVKAVTPYPLSVTDIDVGLETTDDSATVPPTTVQDMESVDRKRPLEVMGSSSL